MGEVFQPERDLASQLPLLHAQKTSVIKGTVQVRMHCRKYLYILKVIYISTNVSVNF